MKKRLFAALLVLSLLLSGCHGARERSSFRLPEALDTDRQFTVTFWAKNDTNINQVNVYKQAIAEFEEIYPNITVEMRLYTDYGRIYNDVITNISTGTTPNVCITYPDHIATYLTGENVVVPLDDLLTDESYGLGGKKVNFDAPTKGEMVPEFLEECRFGGHQYALPYMRSTEACYVNKDYVEKLGFTLPEVLTWDFVWQVSEAAMEKEGDVFKVNGQKVLIPFLYKSTDNMMIQMLHQLGADYSDASGHIGLFHDTTREILKTVAAHAKTRAFSTFAISSYPANFLNAGQCIFAVDSTAGSTWMGSHAPLLDISADALVAQLYAAGGEMADYLGRRFGERLLEDDGSVCKPALLEAMQQDPGLRKEVEQMVHALVRDAILAFWDKAEAGGKNCAVAEIPLYFECGWHKAGLPGALSLTVRCPREIRLQRIMATRGWSEEKTATLEAWQWSAERKEAASDLVVDNAGTPADLRARIPALLEQLTALRQQAQDDILRQVTACWQA